MKFTFQRGGWKMLIKTIPYKANNTRKFNVICNGHEYTCYLNPYNGDLVVTGNGKNENYRDISDTTLGLKIALACHTYKEE